MNDATTTIATLKDLVQDFVKERAWEPFHDPKNLAMSIAIETAELMEHVQWLRSDQLADLDDEQRAGLQEEIADVLCYVLSFASTTGIDLAAALEVKMVKNREKYPADRFRGRFR